MKTKLFTLAVSIIMIAFAVNTTVMAQNKETKKPEKIVMHTNKKIEKKTSDVKLNADMHKKRIETVKKETEKSPKGAVKTEVKKETEKKVSKTHKAIKHHKMPLKKTGTKKTETEKPATDKK
jgi:hypothetical protein